MKKTNPKVLFVFTQRRSKTSTWFGGFSGRLQKRPGLEGIDIDYLALEDLIFEIKDNKATVTDARTGKPVEHYTWVYFKRWMSMPDEAAAFAIFLHARGIPFADDLVINKNDGSKLVSAFRFWSHGVAIADTLYCAKHHVKYALDNTALEYPLIVKDAFGQKGKLNFIAQNEAEVLAIVDQYPDTFFLIQHYIENKFDYRVQVYGGRAAVVVKRVGKEGSHLNNESAGGASSFVPKDKVSKEVLDIAERACEAVGLQVSGVDVLPNVDETKFVILEANQGGQIVSGDTSGDQVALLDEFNKYVAQMAKSRIKAEKKIPGNHLHIVGLHENVDLTDFGLNGISAKVDTGAYRCSLHAENIEEVKRDGKTYLRFDIPESTGRGKSKKMLRCEAESYGVSVVKKSTTVSERRYIIKTHIRVGGRKFFTSFTLTNRGSMRYPILIGRRVLGGRFLVNPSLSTKD